MAKTLFVQPNYDISIPEEKIPWMPLASVELATFIREKGNHKVKVFDRNLYPKNSDFLEVLKKFNPDVVAMTCYTSPVIRDVKQISKIIKENSKALVIVGGIHATLEPDSLLDYKSIDYVVRGEGEETLLEICNLIDKNKANKKNMLKIKNVNHNPMRPLLDLRTSPIMDYDLLEVKEYPVATFCTSRGCPGRCRFCYNQGRALRFYDADKIIKMMTGVIEKYNIREFTIADDNFANLSVRTTKICNALSKYNCIFHCFLRVDQAHDKVMKDLKHAGCWAIQFGFESGSQRILDFINKGTTIKQNIEAIRQCKKFGIFVDGSFMTGLPTETISEMNETVNFIKTYKPDVVDIKVFKPYPSTELFHYAVEKGLLKKPKNLEEWENFCDLKEGNINLSKIPTKTLLKTVNDLSKSQSFTYLKKTFLLLKGGHINYTLFKIRDVLKSKLGIKQDTQKSKK